MRSAERGIEVEDVLDRAVLLLLGAVGAGLVGLMLWPFMPAIVTAGTVALLVYPVHGLMLRRFAHPSGAAFLSTLAVVVLIVLPAAGVAMVVGEEIGEALTWVRREGSGFLAPRGPVSRALYAAAAYLGVEPAGLMAGLDRQIQQLAGLVANRAVGFLSGLGGWLLQAGAALFTLYYLLRDGDRVVEAIRLFVPLPSDQAEQLLLRAREVTYATVYGNVVVALVQGLIGGLAFAALDVRGAALWGAVMALLSLLPVIGAPLIWVPAAVWLLATGAIGRGLILIAIGTLIISTVDNLLRAVLVSGRGQLHPLVVFFSVLGGLVVFGAAGLLVGPVVFVTAITLVQIARLALEVQGVAPEAEPAFPEPDRSSASAGH